MTYSRLRLHNQKLPRATVSRLRLLSVPTQATSQAHRPLSTQAKMRSTSCKWSPASMLVHSRPRLSFKRPFIRPACKQAQYTEELDSGTVYTASSTSVFKS